ncbi:hypothetical protein EV363DRAFT_1359471 [Boletus edulis]|uniref:DUF6533 domain-containing protein n=1 Tax=Boletus edulis BED1 TaxID=1328754 RepID=A0AAD4BMS3_BOLED|nr:hypothetical protein EV363DRAFT_1359471 [Boletus edulis]KAF8434535.1 hypothetical protein L210DRAFT_3553147 [Boletus edulis BED1]
MSVGAETEKYLRIASISIAAYDYLITLPAEVRFYRSQPTLLRPSLGCVLFVLIRYVSIIVMVVSNYGVLATSFTMDSCNNYYLVAPFFKGEKVLLALTWVAQFLCKRTFNIARRDRNVGVALAIAFAITTALDWFTNMYRRVRDCTPGNDGRHPTAWIYYVISILWDTGTLSVSTIYLVRYNAINGRLSRLIRTMIYDGLGYFLVLTGANVFNLILASLGYAVTWIMSQRILLHLRELSEPAELARFDNIILTRPMHHGRSVVSALRSQGEIKTAMDMEYGPTPPHDLELDVRVVVEQSVSVDYDQSSKRRLV